MRQDKKRVRVMGALVFIFAVLSLAALAAGWLAESQRKLAVQREQEATAQSHRNLALRLAAEARELAPRNPQRALLLAVEAVRATTGQGYVLPAARATLEQTLSGVGGVGLAGHVDNVRLAEFSDNEIRLATGGADNSVRVWDLDDLKQPRTTHILPQPNWPSTVLFDHTGRNVLTHSRLGDKRTSALVWSLEAGRRYPQSTPLLAGGPSIDALGANRSAGLVAAARTGGSISILSLADLSSPKVLRELAPPTGDTVISLSFARDGKVLVAGTDSALVWIWDLSSESSAPVVHFDTGLRVPKPVVKAAHVDIIGISDDHTTLFTASSEWFDNSGWADMRALVWKLDWLRPVASHWTFDHGDSGKGSALIGAFFDQAQRNLITVSLNGAVRGWALGTAPGSSLAATVPAFIYRAGRFGNGADMTTDRSALALTQDRDIRVLATSELAKGQEARGETLAGFDGNADFVRFSPTGKLLVAGGLDDTVRIWRVGTGDHGVPVIAMPGQAAPEGSDALLSADGRYATTLQTGHLNFWDLQDPLKPRLRRHEPVSEDQKKELKDCLACTVLFSPDQRWVVVQSAVKDESMLLSLDENTGHQTVKIPARTWINTYEVTYSPDARWLSVEKAGDSRHLVYDLQARGGAMQPIEVVLPPGSYSRVFSPDSKFMLFRRHAWKERAPGGAAGLLIPMDAVNDASRRLNLEGFPREIGSTFFSRSGAWLALSAQSDRLSGASGETRIRLLKIEHGALVSGTSELAGSEFAPDSLQFSPDERWLLSASTDILLQGKPTATRLWDLNARDIGASGRALPGVNRFLRLAEFSPDNKFLLTISGGDVAAKLWRLDMAEPRLVAELSGPQPQLNNHWTAVFSPDSLGLVLSTTDDPTPFYWRLDSGDVPNRGTPIQNGDRAIASIAFSQNGNQLVILNSGGTTTATSGSSGSHVTIVDVKALPSDTAAYRVTNVEQAAARASLREDIGLLLIQGKRIDGAWIGVDALIQQAETAVGRNLRLEEWTKAEMPGQYRTTFPGKVVDAKTLRALATSLPKRSENAKPLLEVNALVVWTRQLDDAALCNDIAWELVTRRAAQQAFDAVSCALKHFPDDANFRDTRGVAQAMLGKRAEALADFNYFVSASADDPKLTEIVDRRRRWISGLEKGEDPFRGGVE